MPAKINVMEWIRRQPRWRLGLAGAVIVLLGWAVLRSGKTVSNGTTFVARRGNLAIKVIEGGSIEAMESQDIRSEIKGYQGTKILKIAEEGYLVTDEDVRTGKVLVEFDASEIRQRAITEEIQFQSTLAALTEAQQSFDIQLNQNRTDIKAAEQKAKFAEMDFEKYVGDGLAQQIILKLDLHEQIYTNSMNLAQFEVMVNSQTSDTNGFSKEGATNRPALKSGAGALATANSDAMGKKPETGASNGSPRPGMGAAPHPSQFSNPSQQIAAALKAQKDKIDFDFSQYADTNKLGDGSAKQALNKLMDDLQVSVAQLIIESNKLDGTRKLFNKGFVPRTELESEQITYTNNLLKAVNSRIALDLFNKYEFPKAAQEFLSKYDESLRSMERTRKEAISKLAQSLAKMRAAEGRYRIEYEQRLELLDQLENCVIRAEKTGLVVYANDRRYGNEQIREGATVREHQRIITIPDMKQMSVSVKIHEAHIKKIKKGLPARITVDAYPDEVLNGEVSKVGVLPDSQDRWLNPDLKVYITVIDIKEVRDWVKPGMSAKVDILVKQLTNVVYIPLQSVSVNQGKQVCYVASSMKPEMRVIQVGDFNDEFIEVKSGLKEKEKVLLRAPEGDRVDEEKTDPEEMAPPGEASAPKPNGNVEAPAAPRRAPDAASDRPKSGGNGDRPRGDRQRGPGGAGGPGGGGGEGRGNR